MSHVRIAVAMFIAVALAGGILLAQAPLPIGPVNPVNLEVLGATPNAVSLQTTGAWPLTIRMTSFKPFGIGTYQVPFPYPIRSQRAFIVFADPDGCFSLAKGATCDEDETYLEFTPGVNLPDYEQQAVDDRNPARLGDRPTLMGCGGNVGTPIACLNDTEYSIGPFVGAVPDGGSPCGAAGGEGCDNYGYGASPNLPGLVILSDAGVGLVWDPVSFVVDRQRARNLAGFVNSVAWTVNERLGWRSSSVTAHMNVPVGLFTPVVRLDPGWPAEGGLKTGRWYSIDGGPTTEDPNSLLSTVLTDKIITLRVFVVSGHAPAEITDGDGDYMVTAKDAAIMGLKVLSDEVVFRLRTLHQQADYEQGVLFDFDGNGIGPIVAPGGSGGVTPIPR